jgi:hypothetical protein
MNNARDEDQPIDPDAELPGDFAEEHSDTTVADQEPKEPDPDSPRERSGMDDQPA